MMLVALITTVLTGFISLYDILFGIGDSENSFVVFIVSISKLFFWVSIVYILLQNLKNNGDE